MVTDTTTTVDELRQILMDFSRERNWQKRRNPQQLAKSLIIESAELLQEFQWMNDAKSQASKKSPSKKKKIIFELVDILYYLITLFDVYQADISKSTIQKLKMLEIRYPKAKKK